MPEEELQFMSESAQWGYVGNEWKEVSKLVPPEGLTVPLVWNFQYDQVIGSAHVLPNGTVEMVVTDPKLAHNLKRDTLSGVSINPEPAVEKEESGLVRHARVELERLGEEPDVIQGYLKVIQAFADMGHSGGSASVAIPTINTLLQFHNLTPLTNDGQEWMYVGEGMWQNKRNSEAFSEDGGSTYWLLSEGGNANWPYPRHKSVEV